MGICKLPLRLYLVKKILGKGKKSCENNFPTWYLEKKNIEEYSTTFFKKSNSFFI